MPVPAGIPAGPPATYRPVFTGLLPDLITLDGWMASAVDDQLSEWWLTGLDGWHGTPDLRLAGLDRPQDHGQYDSPSYAQPRIVTASGTTIAPDRTTALLARDIVSSLCWDTTRLYPLQVTEPGRPTRQCAVRLNTGIKVSEVSGTAFDWQLQLKAPDPRKYAANATTFTLYAPTGVTGGFTAPFTAPFTSSTVGVSSSTATATNTGTTSTRPVVVFNGPLTDPQIANLTAGLSVVFTGITLATGDTLTVDFDRRTALLNGTASRASALSYASAWWELAPGSNDLMFTAGGGSGSAVVTFQPAWW